MEEQVGALWHQAITRFARASRASLPAGRGAPPTSSPRPWASCSAPWAATAGSRSRRRMPPPTVPAAASCNGWPGPATRPSWPGGTSAPCACREVIDCFPDAGLNRDLYLWLAALAVGQPGAASGDPADPVETWLLANQWLTRRALADASRACRPRYRRLVAAHLALRPEPSRLPAAEAARERADPPGPGRPRQRRCRLPLAKRPPHPVPLWLHPHPGPTAPGPPRRPGRGAAMLARRPRRVPGRAPPSGRRAGRSMPEKDQGLVTIRMENILTWGEYVQVDRGTDEDEDLERAEDRRRDMDRIGVARDRQRLRGTPALRPGPAVRSPRTTWCCGDGTLLAGMGLEAPAPGAGPLPGACRCWPTDAPPCPLPPTWCAPPGGCAPSSRRWPRRGSGCAASPTGRSSTSMPTCASPPIGGPGIGAPATPCTGTCAAAPGTWPACCWRTCPCPPTAYVDDQLRVIDVIRDSLFLFAESLSATGDRFGAVRLLLAQARPGALPPHQGLRRALQPAPCAGASTPSSPATTRAWGRRSATPPTCWQPQPAGRRLLLLLIRRQAQRPGPLRRPLRHRGHPPRRRRRPPPGPDPLLRHHRRARQRLPAPPVRQRRLRGHPPSRRTAAQLPMLYARLTA